MEEAVRRIQQMNPHTGELDLDELNLVELPPLPEGVRQLYCSANQLARLPPLPSTLIHLSCNNNKLVTLPPLPSTLRRLGCASNKLITLPPLPETLTHLICYNNRLTSLPELPKNLQLLNCMGNKLVTLPRLPESLTQLIYTKNPFKEPLKTFLREYEKEYRNTDSPEARLRLMENLLHKIRNYQMLTNKKLEAAIKYKYHPNRIQRHMDRNQVNKEGYMSEENWEKYFTRRGEVWTEGVGQAYGPWMGGKTRGGKTRGGKTKTTTRRKRTNRQTRKYSRKNE
jgi:Leucine-rich repeat (LRR) protein